MQTRCPACHTVFRVTPEQLKLKAGKVRCGQCSVVFDANKEILPEVSEHDESISPETSHFNNLPGERSLAAAYRADTENPEPAAALHSSEISPTDQRAASTDMVSTSDDGRDGSGSFVDDGRERARTDETVERSTEDARLAGLMAARDLNETAAYNRWASGTLAGNGGYGLVAADAHDVRWPFWFMGFVLLLALVVQAAFQYRTALVQRIPEVAAVFKAAAVDVPLPRQVDLVSIEASDLQADTARGLLVLQATLRNRATFDQAWPVLELTLTDAQDAAISRRILLPDEYLPAAANRSHLAARGELGLRLWLEAKEIAPAGYRLYVFYP